MTDLKLDTTLPAEARPSVGKGAARKGRAAGKVPAVLYSEGGSASPIAVDPKKLLEIFRKSQDRNTILQLALDGAVIPVIVQEVQRHPVSRALLHVDFYKLAPGKAVTVKVPVAMVGKAAGVAVGGRARVITRELTVRCAYDRIPRTIDVDVTPLEVGQFVRASQIPAAEGVAIVFDHDFNVVGCEGKASG